MLLLELYLSFIKPGLFCFGGYAMIPVINGEMLSHGWMTLTELSDVVAIAEMTPGSFGINSATFVGMKMAGVLGAIAATLGVMTPSLTLGMLAGHFMKAFKNNRYLERALYGIRPICVGMLAAVIMNLISTSYFAESGSLISGSIITGIVISGLMYKFKPSVPVLVLIAAGLGLIFT